MERLERSDRERSDQCVRRRAGAAGEQHRQIGPFGREQAITDAHRVRDDHQVGHAVERTGEVPRRRAGGQADRGSGSDQRGGGRGDRLLLVDLGGRLDDEAGLDRRREASAGSVAPPWTLSRTPAWSSASRSRLIVMSLTPGLGEIADAGRSVTLHVLGDQLASPAGQHAPLAPARHVSRAPAEPVPRPRHGRRSAGESQHISPPRRIDVRRNSVRIRWFLLDLGEESGESGGVGAPGCGPVILRGTSL